MREFAVFRPVTSETKASSLAHAPQSPLTGKGAGSLSVRHFLITALFAPLFTSWQGPCAMPTDQVINGDANGIPINLRVLRIVGGVNPQSGRYARGLRPVDSRVDAFLTTAKTVERAASEVRRIGTNWLEKREDAISPTPSGLSGNPARGSGFSSLEERKSRGGGGFPGYRKRDGVGRLEPG